MNDLEYIDRFLKGQLSPEELREFEQRLTGDPAFAEEVAFYSSAWQHSREEAVLERKKTFREIYNRQSQRGLPSIRRLTLWPYAAAAVVAALLLGWYLFFRAPSDSPRELADQYIKEQLQTVGVTMGAREDSLEKGKSLYNDGKFRESFLLFESLARLDSSNTDAVKLAGLSALRLSEYDKAISYFSELENYPGLYANPGKFLRALTLLKRGAPGDSEEARKTLQEVVDEDLDNKELAEEWLRHW